MALWSRVSDALKPKAYTARYPHRIAGKPLLYASSAAASLGDALLGFSQGITAVFQVQPLFIDRIFGMKVTDKQIKAGRTGVHPLQAAILIGSVSVTALLASLMSAYVLERLGRRKSIRIGATLFLIASCIQMIAADLSTLIVGRAIQGLGAGLLSTSVPIFQVEIAPANVRGALAGMEMFCMNAGYAASAWVGYAFFLDARAEHTWRGPYAVQAAISLVLILWTFFLPESPRWLILNGFLPEGLRTFADLHGGGDVDDVGVNSTFSAIIDQLEMDKKRFGDRESAVGLWLRLFRSYPRRSRIGVTARMFAQLNGINAILHFLPEHLVQAGFNIPHALYYASLCSIFNCLGTLPTILFIEKLGRRRILLIGSVALACSLVLVGCLQMYSHRWPTMLSSLKGARGVFIGMSIYLFFFGATWGPVPWLLSAELFPIRMRARGMSITTASDWFFETIVAVATPALSTALGGAYYYILAGACVLSGFVVWLWYVETAGRSLETIGGMFGDPMPPPRRLGQHDVVMMHESNRRFRGQYVVSVASGIQRDSRPYLQAPVTGSTTSTSTNTAATSEETLANPTSVPVSGLRSGSGSSAKTNGSAATTLDLGADKNV